jgi:hypothetical protein
LVGRLSRGARFGGALDGGCGFLDGGLLRARGGGGCEREQKRDGQRPKMNRFS